MNKNLDRSVKKFGYSSYEDYLASESWAQFREDYKYSDKPQACLHCGSEQFQLHHITYKRICRESLDDVIPLCRSCHVEEHRRKREKQKEQERKHVSEAEVRDFLSGGMGIESLKKKFSGVSKKRLIKLYNKIKGKRPKKKFYRKTIDFSNKPTHCKYCKRQISPLNHCVCSNYE